MPDSANTIVLVLDPELVVVLDEEEDIGDVGSRTSLCCCVPAFGRQQAMTRKSRVRTAATIGVEWSAADWAYSTCSKRPSGVNKGTVVS